MNPTNFFTDFQLRSLERARRAAQLRHEMQMWALEERRARIECDMLELKKQLLERELDTGRSHDDHMRSVP